MARPPRSPHHTRAKVRPYNRLLAPSTTSVESASTVSNGMFGWAPHDEDLLTLLDR
jgi:hypothetical protein